MKRARPADGIAGYSMKVIPGACGVVLAAGQSSRMGREKALLVWPPGSVGTLLGAGIAAIAPYTETVIVVVGKNKERLGPVARASGATMVENPKPELGQFGSLRVGLGELVGRGFSSAIISPVDSPPLSGASLEALVAEFLRAKAAGKWAVAPGSVARHGHPLIASREMIEAFLDAPAESNAKVVRGEHEERIAYVESTDPLLGMNVNTPEDYAALCRLVSGVCG
jgi:molybdenum cofactor cytidylyltransferase